MSSRLEDSVGAILAEREKNGWFGLQAAGDLWDSLEEQRYEDGGVTVSARAPTWSYGVRATPTTADLIPSP